ncbi:hypothetical protein [Salinicola sp. NYA28a]
MTSHRLTAIAAILGFTLLTGCSSGPVYTPGGYTTSAPIVSTPRVYGGTTSTGSQGRASTVIGNSSTPARVYLNSRMTSEGVDIVPTLRSRFLNWTFR